MRYCSSLIYSERFDLLKSRTFIILLKFIQKRVSLLIFTKKRMLSVKALMTGLKTTPILLDNLLTYSDTRYRQNKRSMWSISFQLLSAEAESVQESFWVCQFLMLLSIYISKPPQTVGTQTMG